MKKLTSKKKTVISNTDDDAITFSHHIPPNSRLKDQKKMHMEYIGNREFFHLQTEQNKTMENVTCPCHNFVPSPLPVHPVSTHHPFAALEDLLAPLVALLLLPTPPRLLRQKAGGGKRAARGRVASTENLRLDQSYKKGLAKGHSLDHLLLSPAKGSERVEVKKSVW